MEQIRHPMYPTEYIQKEKELKNDFTEKYQRMINEIFKERQEKFNGTINRQRNVLLMIFGIITLIGFILTLF